MGARALIVAALLTGCASALSTVRPPPAPVATADDAGHVPARARYHYLVARVAIAEGDWEEAEQALQTALLHDPGSPWILLALAEVAQGAGETSVERDRLREAVRVAPGLPVAWSRLADAELRSGDARAAVAALREAVDIGAGDDAWATLCRLLVQRDEPDAAGMVRKWSARPLADGELFRERGRLRLQIGDVAGAAVDLGEALPHSPHDARLLDEYLTAVTGSGLYRQGLARLDTVQRIAPGDTDVLLRTYHLAAQAQDPVRAADALLKLDAALGGEDAQVKLWLADARSQLGQHDVALAALDDAGRCDPPLSDLAYHRARLLRAAGRPAEALKALRVPEAGANRGDALALRVKLLVDLGRAGEARREAEAGLAQLPDDYALLGALVTACAAQSDRAGMLAAVDRMAMLDDEARARTRARSLAGMGDVENALLALRATPMKDPESWVLGATLLRDAGRAGEAVGWLERAVDRFPKDAGLRAELGMALDAAGSAEAALVAMREALRLDPGEGRAARYYARAVRQAGDGDRLKQVRGWLLAALERNPADADLLDSLGQIELAMHEPLRAVDAWEEALRYRPGDPDLLRELAAAYREVGRSEQAEALEARLK
ncbi:MAG: tetratricopeptide repeat protein [Myxococcota bacterium]